MAKPDVRVERDSLGEKEVPADAYYGIQTARAVENFRSAASAPIPRSSPPSAASRGPRPR